MTLRKSVLRQSAQYAVLGVGIGGGVFLLAGRAFQTMFYGVSLWNPLLLSGCGLVMGMVCIAAATLPAIRAGRISPAEALLE